MSDNRVTWDVMHQDAWWERVLDSALSPEEESTWKEHLQSCARCRAEWEALAQVDWTLSLAPEVPRLSQAFTEQTVDVIWRLQRRRRWLSWLAGSAIVAVVGVAAYTFLGSAVASIGHGVAAVLASRDILFWSLIRVALSLMGAWKALLPYILSVTGFGLLLMMPNGLLASLFVVWLSRRRRLTAAEAIVA